MYKTIRKYLHKWFGTCVYGKAEPTFPFVPVHEAYTSKCTNPYCDNKITKAADLETIAKYREASRVEATVSVTSERISATKPTVTSRPRHIPRGTSRRQQLRSKLHGKGFDADDFFEEDDDQPGLVSSLSVITAAIAVDEALESDQEADTSAEPARQAPEPVSYDEPSSSSYDSGDDD